MHEVVLLVAARLEFLLYRLLAVHTEVPLAVNTAAAVAKLPLSVDFNHQRQVCRGRVELRLESKIDRPTAEARRVAQVYRRHDCARSSPRRRDGDCLARITFIIRKTWHEQAHVLQPRRQPDRPTGWRVSRSVEVPLRNLARVHREERQLVPVRRNGSVPVDQQH